MKFGEIVLGVSLVKTVEAGGIPDGVDCMHRGG